MSITGPGGNTPGTNLNRLMDTLGFADQLGDIYGASLDAAIGNNLGVARNLFDAFSPLSTKQLDRMMAGGFPGAGHCHRPHHDFAHHFHQNRGTHYEREGISTYDTGNIFDRKSQVEIDGQKVNVGNMPKGMKPAEFESKLQGDPALRARVEQQIGGRIVYDGKADGRITVAKNQYHPCLPFHNQINQHCQNMLGRLFQPGMQGQILNNLANFLGSLPGMPGAGGAGGAGQPGGAGQAGGPGQAGGKGGAGQAGGQDLKSILNDPNLSFEEKLFQFMLAFASKKEKEIEAKMAEMDKAKQSGQAGGAGGGKKAGGAGGAKGGGKASPIGKVANLAGGAMQGIMGGLAGGPMGAVMGNNVGGGGGGQGGQAGGAGGEGGAGGAKSEQTLQAELQRLQSALQQMFTTISKMEEAYDGFVKGVASALAR